LEAKPKKISMRIWCVAIWPSPAPSMHHSRCQHHTNGKKKRAFTSFLIFREIFRGRFGSVFPAGLEKLFSSSSLFSQGFFIWCSCATIQRVYRITRAGSLLFGRGIFFLFKFGSESQFLFALAFVYFCVYV
jgi:hypothetical protein